jgi:hypothetical protein
VHFCRYTSHHIAFSLDSRDLLLDRLSPSQHASRSQGPFSVTSAQATLFQGKETTGLFITEALHPFNVLIAAGFEVDFASERNTLLTGFHNSQIFSRVMISRLGMMPIVPFVESWTVYIKQLAWISLSMAFSTLLLVMLL